MKVTIRTYLVSNLDMSTLNKPDIPFFITSHNDESSQPKHYIKVSELEIDVPDIIIGTADTLKEMNDEWVSGVPF